MLADHGVGSESEGGQVERGGHVPGGAGQEGVGLGSVDDRVPVAPGPGRVAGVEVRGHDRRVPHHHLRAAEAVQRALEGDEVEAVAGGVEGHDLPPGVHAGVGPAGHGQADPVAQQPLERLDEHAADGADPRVGRDAREAAAVVGHRQPHP